MRIGVISDLHIDRNSNEIDNIPRFGEMLANELSEQQIDLLLIAGDVSDNHVMSHQFVEHLKRRTGKTILFVPGNHDYWNKGQEEKNTYRILDYFKAQEESIIEQPYIVNDEWAIVGHSGWYDYTFADDRFSTQQLSDRSYNDRVWKDKLHVDWRMDDKEVSKLFATTVQADLEKVKDKNIILMTHFITYKNFAVQMPHPIFDYFNAFIGSSDYEALHQEYPIKYNIMGHVHYRRREKNGMIHICACLGNRNEWQTTDLETELRNALQIIEI